MNSYCCNRLHSFFLLLFAILVAGTGRSAGAQAVKCLPDQGALLLDLKHGFRFEYHELTKHGFRFEYHELSKRLVSWKPGSNCCSWEGVTCDTESGHVIGLDLSERYIYGNLSSSLFNLTSLQTLNLAWNYFEGVPIPQSGFEKLAKLTHLNLSLSRLSGQIPIGISRLTGLISLDLSSGSELQLRNPNLQMLVKNLSNLRVLNLDGVNMSTEHDWSKTLSKSLPRLQVLSLVESDLPGSLPKDFFSTYKNLTDLDLSYNPRLSGALPDFPTYNALKKLKLDWVNMSSEHDWSKTLSTSLPRLQVLSLRSCDLPGSLPKDFFSTYKNLTDLNLSGNPRLSGALSDFPTDNSLKRLNLVGVNMSSVHNWSKTLSTSLPRLQFLCLSSCDLPGSLPKDFFSTYKNLTDLDLSYNPRLSGDLPDFPMDNALQTLQLSYSNFSGPIPASIANLTQLVDMGLQSNCLTGVIPTSIESLIQLEIIDLSSNHLGGPVPSFEPQTKLSLLFLSNNSLIGPIPMSLFCLPDLKSLDLSYNQLSGELGEFLNPTTSLHYIDLSNNQLHGWVPRSISKMPGVESFNIASNNFSVELDMFNSLRNLYYLDVSNNQLIRDVSENNFHTFPKLSEIYLASCSLSKIPTFLRYQERLVVLELSNNRINGSIPKWIWSSIFLNLSFNSFSNIEGQIDLTTTNLRSIDLQFNMLQGPIPLPPPDILHLDYSNNNFSSTIPSNISFYLNQIRFFSLANNIITGEIPPSICTAKTLQVLDFSNNSLSGSIPSCLLKGDNSLRELNLRENQLRGIIPQNISKRCTLERIMLDGNNLQGQLPRSLVNCKSLEVLDLGNNQFMDSFPFWLRDLITLRVLILRANKFYGPINFVQSPGINYTLPKLQIFDLSSNHFNGSISSDYFTALKAMLNYSQLDSSIVGFDFVDLRGNFVVATYIYDVVSITNKGEKSTMRKLLTIFTYIDFSNNAFEGDIPEVIGELQGLHVLNLSHNFLSGEMPPTIGNMIQIESLDLSANSLSGEIPKEMMSLTFLSYLNLSDNNFIGKIPQGNQFSTFSNTSFQENPGLCGIPLSKQCGNVSPKITDTMSPSMPDSSSSTYVIGLALFVGLGFGVGIAVVLVLQNVPLKFWRKK